MISMPVYSQSNNSTPDKFDDDVIQLKSWTITSCGFAVLFFLKLYSYHYQEILFPDTSNDATSRHADKFLQEHISERNKGTDLRSIKLLGTGLCILTCLTARSAYRIYRKKKLSLIKLT